MQTLKTGIDHLTGGLKLTASGLHQL